MRYLVVLQAQVAQKPVVLLDFHLEFLYTRLVSEVEVTSNETLVQLDYLAEAQMLARGLVQSSCCLEELSGHMSKPSGT
jgi:hypothetical protein